MGRRPLPDFSQAEGVTYPIRQRMGSKGVGVKALHSPGDQAGAVGIPIQVTGNRLQETALFLVLGSSV